MESANCACRSVREQLERPVDVRPVVLTHESVLAYVEALALPHLAGAQLVVTDSSTGNLNYCFVVAAPSGAPSVFVKQAPDFVRCLGEDAKLTTDRIRIEVSAALEFMELAPGFIPELFHFDPASCVVVMEYLNSHTLLQDRLLCGEVSSGPAVAVAQFMAKIHAPTFGSTQYSGFTNEHLCGITSTYVFTLPFTTHETNSNMPELDVIAGEIRSDEALLSAIRAAHELFLNKKEALIHGDLHAGSVMTDGNNAKVIDHEFSFFGPAGFDLGLFLAGYTFPYASARAHGDADKAAAIVQAMTECVAEYKRLMVLDAFSVIWRDSLGFMGCELLRRVLGVAKRADLETITDDRVKFVASSIVCRVGREAILSGFGGGLANMRQLLDLFDATSSAVIASA